MRFEEFARLDELAGTKVYNPQKITNLRELETFMAQFGFNMISGGEFSRVFENSKLREVVKVYNDECYDKFIAICKANPGDPHLPKFKGTSVRIRPDARMIRIERLEPMSYDEIKAIGLHTLMRIAKENVFLVRGDDEEAPEVTWSISPESLSLLRTLELLYTNLDQNSCWVDLNSGNIMRRGNQVVIIDPYAPNRTGWGSTHK